MTSQKTLNHHITILVVDDSQTQRAMLEYLLEKQGYQLLSAKNGREALEMVKKHLPQLVITDIIMPEMDGLALCKAIKTDKALQQIPVILMTALTGIEEIGHGLEVGADNFIYKPYDDRYLLSHIKRILKHKAFRRQEQPMGVQIILGGKKYRVNSDREKILDLLVSSVEDAVYMNQLLQGREAELQMAKEAAEISNVKKSKFLASMSHEIRTPMTSILGLLELLNLSHLDSEQHDTLDTIYESSRSLLRIIDDILDFSKIEAGKLDIVPKVASIPEIIKKIYNLYSGSASRKGLVLTSFCSPKIPPAVVVDALRLQQILGNFISNAIKFTDQGSVDLRADWIEQTDNLIQLEFSVKDTGIGISHANQKSLFQPFVQVSDSSMRDFGGTGLGLVICRRLTTLMDGQITLESELGKGTTTVLKLSLPIADPQELVQINAENPIHLLADTLAKRRNAPDITTAEKENTLVLIVDDHPVNRNVLLRQLNIIGYAAEGVQSGIEALTALKTKHYALMITDCNMPNMDGYVLTRTVRKLEIEQNLKRLPIVACTANATNQVNIVCSEAGMDDCLIKPVTLAGLIHLMDRWLAIPIAAPIDSSCLVDVVGHDEAAQREILMNFKNVFDSDSVLLSLAVQKNDLSETINLAHRIKGACQVVGAKAMIKICQQIEDASRLKKTSLVKELLIQYKKESDDLSHYLNSR